MDHQDKINMAKVLADPWVFTKKRSIVDVIDGSDYAAEFGQENLAPKQICVNIQPTRPVIQAVQFKCLQLIPCKIYKRRCS